MLAGIKFLIIAWLTIGFCEASQTPLLDVINFIDTNQQEGCNVTELSANIAWCNNTLTKHSRLPEHTLCQSYKGEVYDVICINHKWIQSKIIQRAGGIVRRSIIDVMNHVQQPCRFFCNASGNDPLLVSAPQFDLCPSSTVLFPEQGRTDVMYSWDEPVASDPDGQIIRLEQIVGPAQNSSLEGSVSPGTDYVVSYIATNDDNLKWVCAFTITSEIPACPPIVHIDNGITACSNFNFRGSVCNITCDTGYFLNSTISSVTCQENGTWSYENEVPQCITVRCEDDPITIGNFTNMQFVCEQNADEFDVVCWAMCLSGYTLRNDLAEDELIQTLQDALDDAILQHNISSIEAQNARDTADQAAADFMLALDFYNTSLDTATQTNQLLNEENQILTNLTQQQSEIQEDLSIAQHNLTEAIASNDPSVDTLQDQVDMLTIDIGNLTRSINLQAILVHNLTEDLTAAFEALDAALVSLTNAEAAVNQTEADALAKEAIAEQALNATIAATSAYNDALLLSTTENRVITSYARCLPNGTWDIQGDPFCTDITQPEIKCIPMVVVYLTRDETSTIVTWNIPEATDNSGSVSVVRISGVEPGTSLTAGQYEVVYQAVDNDDNRSPFCNLLINVEEYYCGNLTDLVNDTNMNYECDGYRYGSTCNLSCDFQYDLQGQSSFTCELNTTSGERMIYWDWQRPTCDFVECQLPSAPENGQIDCTDYVEGVNGTTGNGTAVGNGTDSDVIGITCTVICDTGYILPFQTDYVYTCENSTGWSSLNFPSTCIESGMEQDAVYTLQLTYNTFDTCANEDILGFERDLSVILQQEVISYPVCTMGYNCIVGMVTSNCTDDVVAVEFSIIVTCDNDPPLGDACDLSMDQMLSLYGSINSSVARGVLDILGVTLTENWLTAISSDLPQCPDGSVLVGRYCEQCGPGYFYVSSMDACSECGFGSYNNLAGKKSCITCPGQTSTRIRGAPDVSYCIDECPPGSYSPDGLVPCLLCETGLYQDEWGVMECKTCPPDTWTTIRGGNSTEDCVAYDIFFIEAEPNFLLTTVGERMSVVFWILNHQQPDVIIGVYYSEMDPNDYAFALRTEPNAQLLFNGWDNEPTGIEIQPSVWIMIGITWAWPSKELMLFRDGMLVYSTVLNSAVALPDRLMISSNAGTVLAGLSVADRIVTEEEMSQSSTDCARKLTGASFTMDDMASLRRADLKFVPTICSAINATTIDHCDFNACANNAVCIHNDTAGYTCNCTEEYGGPFCEELLVHGGWSQWIFSTVCSVTCGNGTQERYRLCDNPPRSNYGNDCEGNSTETVDCIQVPCQECAAPGSVGGASCVLQNDTCIPVCPDGYILPAGQSDQNYACGHTTNYEWLPLADLPVCSEIQSPTVYNCSLTFPMNRDVPCSVEANLIELFQAIADSLPCVTNHTQCSMTVSITGCVEARRKRQSATSSRLVLLISVPITSTDPLNFTAFYIDNSIGESIQEIVDALTAIEGTVTDLQNSQDVLALPYTDGNIYTVIVTDPNTDIIIVTEIGCDPGQVPTSGVCAVCQQGTYQVGDYCVYCERGTYQSDPSQTSCISCPSGFTTDNVGARTVADCYEIPVPPVPPTPADYTVIIIAVISCVLAIFLILLIVLFARRFYLSSKYRAKYDMEADQISLYTDFPDIAYNVYFKRRQVLGFDEDGFPIISKEPVKNGDIAQYSDVEEEEEEDHRTPTPLPKREPFAYPTEYLDPPFTYDPYRNIDSEVLVPTEVEHVFNFPALKESAVRFRVPGRKHLQNAYPLQQFGLKGKAKSRHRKQLPNPMHIKVTRKLPQLMYRPPKDASLDQIVQEQKAKPRKEVESSPREEYDITPHDHKAPLTLKLSKAQESLSLSIDKRSPRSPRSPRYTAKKGKLRSRGSQRSAKSAQPSKRYQAIIETSSPRPATSTSNRSLKSAISTGSKSARVDTPKSVSIRALSPGPPVIDTHEDFTHPKPSRIVVPKLSINIPPKSMLKNTMTSVRNERPETGRKSVIFQDEEKPTRPSTSATRIDEAPLSASKLAKEKTVGLSLSRHKPHYRPYESELVETYRPESQITRPDSPLYRPVSSSTRASSPTIHPKPVIHDGVTVQRRSDFIMFNPPTNLSFNVGLPPNDHSMKLMKPPPALIKVKPKPRRSTIRLPHRFNDMEVWDDNISATGSFFMTEIPDSPLPSRASGGSHISDRHSFRSRRQSKVRFKKDSPPPAYTEAAHDTVIESAREGSQYNLV